MTLYLHAATSPLGKILIAVVDDGALVNLTFCENDDAEAVAATLSRPGEIIVWDAARCEPVARQLQAYFCGERQTFALPLALRGTPFQQQVWEELTRIPYGTTVSYRELAERVGRPTASRAVGQANGANPVVIVVPCHRVVGARGTLTGYAYGVSRKQKLLQLEGADRSHLPTRLSEAAVV